MREAETLFADQWREVTLETLVTKCWQLSTVKTTPEGRNGGSDVKGYGGLLQDIIGQHYFVMFLFDWFLTYTNEKPKEHVNNMRCRTYQLQAYIFVIRNGF